MKKEFIVSQIELMYLSANDIITTSNTGNGSAGEIPPGTMGPGGGIDLPFDPFSY